MDNCPIYYSPVVEYENTFNLEIYRSACKLFDEKKIR